jgi:O-antigen/teichoic acid export membrane protein
MIYTGGNVLARGLNFIIQVTIWSNLFPPDAYGQIAYCYVFISFMAVILPLGLDAAFMNYYVRGGKKANYLKNTLFLILSLAAVFSLIAILFRHTLAPLVIRVDSGKLFILSLGILFFDIINNQGLLYLRAEGKAIQYILWANLASSGTIFLIFLFILLPRMKGAKLSGVILSELLVFGMPFLLSGIFDRTVELADRRLIGYFLGDEATGLYVASYTVAVLMRLLVLSFNAGWQPYFLNEIDKEGGRQKLETIFNRTGIIFVAVWFIASVWLPELVRIPLGQGRYILHPSYWEGMSVIPVIMGAYVMMGLYFLQLPDLYHQKKTALNALFIGIGAALNLILNLILIPRMGIMGAAIATAVAYLAMFLGLRLWRYLRMDQKHVQGKMVIIMVLSMTIFIIMQIIEIQTVTKILITLGYMGLVYAIQPVRIKDIFKR